MKALVLITLLSSTLFLSTVDAKNLYCNGKINTVYVDMSGEVFIHGTWRSNHTSLCNLNESSPSTVTCSLWASYAADAVDKQLPVRVFYAGVDDSLTCGNLPTYSSTPATGYLMILKKP